MNEPRREELGGGVYVYAAPGAAFGADALLLARFAAPRPRERACDLCSGGGVVPLAWLAEGTAPLACAAVELQPAAHALLCRAVEEQGLEQRVSPLCADLRQLEGVLAAGSCDLVTGNPPYFSPAAGAVCADPAEALARQQLTCTPRDLTGAAARLLKTGGRLCFCGRPDALCDLLGACREAGLEPKRLRLAADRPDKPPFLALIEARKGGRPGLTTDLVFLHSVK